MLIEERDLRSILGSFGSLHLGVVGDFFLDAYFDCDPRLDEKSLETGKTCYQVVRTRRQAGAAGTVAANLTALGIGAVDAVGFCGDDGEGYELRRAMSDLGLGLEGFLCCPDRYTPTYGKPCYVDGTRTGKPVVTELERVDIKNRRPTPVGLQQELMAFVDSRLSSWDGIILVDQVQEPNCGVLTSRVRRFLTRLGREHPGKAILVDSRERIGQYRHVMIKPNQLEAARVLGRTGSRVSRRASVQHARALARAAGRAVFLTLGQRGMLVADGDRVDHVPAFPVPPPIDPVGAGDSTSAAIVASLSAGASLLQAATVASLVASITVQQLGTTGTARPGQIRRRYREVERDGL